jgi:tetratricopeptide (TPR) repeat protein
MLAKKLSVVILFCCANCTHVGAAQDDQDEVFLEYLMEYPFVVVKSKIDPAELLKKCSHLLESRSRLSSEQTVALRHHRAAALIMLNRRDDAKEEFDEILRIRPKDVKAKCNRTLCLSTSDALKECERICRDHAEDAIAWEFRGTLHFDARRTQEAIDSLSRAIRCYEKDPTNLGSRLPHALAYFRRGFCRLESGQFDGAYDDLNRSLLIQPYDSARGYDRYLLRGIISFMRDDLNNALADFQMALDLNPKSFHANNLRIRTLLQLGKNRTAENLVERLLKSHPACWDSYLTYTDVLVSVGLNEKAVEVGNRAVNENAGATWPYALLGRVHFRLQDYQKSLEYSGKVRQDDEGYYEAAQHVILILIGAPDAKLRDGKKAKELVREFGKLRGASQSVYSLLLLSMVHAECNEYDEARKLVALAESKGLGSRFLKDLGSDLRKLYQVDQPYRLPGRFPFNNWLPKIAYNRPTIETRHPGKTGAHQVTDSVLGADVFLTKPFAAGGSRASSDWGMSAIRLRSWYSLSLIPLVQLKCCLPGSGDPFTSSVWPDECE